jgi:hypothetical protein
VEATGQSGEKLELHNKAVDHLRRAAERAANEIAHITLSHDDCNCGRCEALASLSAALEDLAENPAPAVAA